MPKKLAKPGTSNSAIDLAVSGSTDHDNPQPHPQPQPTINGLPLPPILTDALPLPRLIVFDLDYTLWPFWVDTHVSPPLKPAPASPHAPTTTAAVDRIGDTFRFYTDVPRILHLLPAVGVRLGVASRTSAPEIAKEMLKVLHVPAAGALASSTFAGAHAHQGGDPHGAADGPRASGESSGSAGRLTLGGSAGKKDKPRRALDFFEAGAEMYPGRKLQHMEALARRAGVAYEDMLFFDDEGRNREVEALGVTFWLVRDGVTWGEVERGIREWRTRRGIR